MQVKSWITWALTIQLPFYKYVKQFITFTQIDYYYIYLLFEHTLFSASYFWVSASDIGRSDDQLTWINNEKVNARLWVPGQPKVPYNGRSGNLCVDLNTSKRKLEVNDCSTQSKVLCEVPLDVIDCFQMKNVWVQDSRIQDLRLSRSSRHDSDLSQPITKKYAIDNLRLLVFV